MRQTTPLPSGPPVEVIMAAGEHLALTITKGAMHDEMHIGLGAGPPQVTRHHLNLLSGGGGM